MDAKKGKLRPTSFVIKFYGCSFFLVRCSSLRSFRLLSLFGFDLRMTKDIAAANGFSCLFSEKPLCYTSVCGLQQEEVNQSTSFLELSWDVTFFLDVTFMDINFMLFPRFPLTFLDFELCV